MQKKINNKIILLCNVHAIYYTVYLVFFCVKIGGVFLEYIYVICILCVYKIIIKYPAL